MNYRLDDAVVNVRISGRCVISCEIATPRMVDAFATAPRRWQSARKLDLLKRRVHIGSNHHDTGDSVDRPDTLVGS